MGTGKCLALLVLCVLGALVQSSSAALYKVGDSAGWSIPSSATFYDEWAKKQTFQVGDILGKLPDALCRIQFLPPADGRESHCACNALDSES